MKGKLGHVAWDGIRLSFLVIMDVTGTSEFYVHAPSLCGSSPCYPWSVYKFPLTTFYVCTLLFLRCYHCQLIDMVINLDLGETGSFLLCY